MCKRLILLCKPVSSNCAKTSLNLDKKSFQEEENVPLFKQVLQLCCPVGADWSIWNQFINIKYKILFRQINSFQYFTSITRLTCWPEWVSSWEGLGRIEPILVATDIKVMSDYGFENYLVSLLSSKWEPGPDSCKCLTDCLPGKFDGSLVSVSQMSDVSFLKNGVRIVNLYLNTPNEHCNLYIVNCSV